MVKMCRCQTRLKLKFDNIQHSIFMFEECHLSQYHQSEGAGCRRGESYLLRCTLGGARAIYTMQAGNYFLGLNVSDWSRQTCIRNKSVKDHK